MKMNRSALAAVMAMVMMGSAVPAFAETPAVDPVTGGVTAETLAVPAEPSLTETGAGDASKIATGGIKNDPGYAAIRERNQYRLTLVAEENQILQQIKAVDAKNKELAAQLKEQRGERKAAAAVKVKPVNTQAEAVKALVAQRKALMDQLKQLKPVKGAAAGSQTDSSSYTALKQQIADLTAQISAQSAAVKEARATAAQKKLDVAGQNGGAAEKSGTLKQYREQIQALAADIKKLRETKEQTWKVFHTHIQARNLDAALADMNKIIDLKQQIIDKLKLILGIKNQITVELTNLLNGGTALPVVPGTVPVVPTTPAA